MAVKVIFPRIDPNMIKGVFVEWRKKEGDWVEKGEVLFVLETGKVTFEAEAPASGILNKVMAHPKDVVEVGTVIGFITQVGEQLPELAINKSNRKSEPAKSEVFPERTQGDAIPKDTGKIIASPLAKKMAREHGLDLSLIKGTGPAKRISKKDVIEYIKQDKRPEPTEAVEHKIEPLSSMRKTIAQRMTESFGSAPHFYLSVDVDMQKLKDIRNDLIPSVEKLTGLRLTYTDLLLKITAQAMEEHPEINVTFSDGGIRHLKEQNLGLAIAVPNGLIVPVIRHINSMSLTDITVRRHDFTERAAKGQVKLDEMRGISMTLTNLGMFGIDQINAIINPPESCILAVGAIRDKPIAENGQIVIKPIMNLTLSIDHRVLDGVVASRFLGKVKEMIEKPVMLIL